MIGVSKSSPYRKALMRLINAINNEIPLKIEKKLKATEEEITRAAVKIDKGLL